MWTLDKVVETFEEYFENLNHIHVPASSLIPPNNDHTLLFTNSGMNQFKPIFLGNTTTELTRVFNIQKCVRAGGKHNDLDDVGKDTYHHTMFSMYGNWSFNYGKTIDQLSSKPYYKEDAIKYAWKLLTEVFKMDKTRFYITYFGGYKDDKIEIPEDIETKQLWENYIDSSRILPFGLKENFWEMATSGPCGPCTEIHYDLIGERKCQNKVNKDDPTVIELWNLVFMQYKRDTNGLLHDLQYRHVDTGGGLERLVTALQDKLSNYDTDIFQPIFECIHKVTGIPYNKSEKTEIAYRIIADHTRTMIHMLNDDIIPSANDRGFIFTKLFKRAYYHACQYLKLPKNHFSLIIEKILKTQIKIYPHLHSKHNIIMYVFNSEELKFGKTIWKAVTHFDLLLNKSNKEITKEEFGYITKTAGIPVDLIEQFARDNNFISVNKISNEESKFNFTQISNTKVVL